MPEADAAVVDGGCEMATIGREGQRIDLGRQVFEDDQLAAGGHLPETKVAIFGAAGQGLAAGCRAV